MFYKRDIEEHTAGQINAKLRELGRLVYVLRNKSKMKIATLTSALDAKNFDMIVECVKEIAAFDVETHQFKKRSLALKLGYSLKKCSKILKAEAIKTMSQDKIEQAERFDAIFNGDWSDSISALASQSIDRVKMNKFKLLPACSDIEKIHNLQDEDSKSTDYSTLNLHFARFHYLTENVEEKFKK